VLLSGEHSKKMT